MGEFESFAARFVRCYWETLKSQRFLMPPNEPINESIEEILAAVSYTTEESGADHILLMRSGDRDWWKYTFRRSAEGWTVTGCSARSLDPAAPHDLLAIPYEIWFRPLLTYATQCAHMQR